MYIGPTNMKGYKAFRLVDNKLMWNEQEFEVGQTYAIDDEIMLENEGHRFYTTIGTMLFHHRPTHNTVYAAIKAVDFDACAYGEFAAFEIKIESLLDGVITDKYNPLDKYNFVNGVFQGEYESTIDPDISKFIYGSWSYNSSLVEYCDAAGTWRVRQWWRECCSGRIADCGCCGEGHVAYVFYLPDIGAWACDFCGQTTGWENIWLEHPVREHSTPFCISCKHTYAIAGYLGRMAVVHPKC